MPARWAASASRQSSSTERCAMPGKPLEGAVDALAGADEERVDDVAEVEARLANERAERRGTPEPAQAGERKGRHVAGIFAEARGRRPSRAVRGAWQGGRTASTPRGQHAGWT